MLALCSVRQSRPGPFHHLAQWGGRLLACDTENLIHQATDRDSWACTFNSIEHHFRHDHPVIHAMSPSTRWRDVLRTDVSRKLGAFVRVVEGYVSVDWLHEIEGFQHFFRCGDVFQVFSAWVQWLQLYYWMYIFWMMRYRLKGTFLLACIITSTTSLASSPSSQLLSLRQLPGSTGSFVLQMFRVLRVSATSAATLRSRRVCTSLCKKG